MAKEDKKRKAESLGDVEKKVKKDKKDKKEKSEKKSKKEKSEKKEKKDKSEKKEKKEKSEKKDKKDKKEKKEKEQTTSEVSEFTNDTYTEAPALTGVAQSEIDQFLSTNEVTVEDPNNSGLRPLLSFEHVKLHPTIQSVVAKFPKPTPIQAVAWPYLLSGNDVIGVAETGSGKTFAFGVPAIHKLLNEGKKSKKNVRVLCVSPTRELAVQIYDNLITLTKDIKCVCVYGGVSKDDQVRELQGAQVVIATPGRLLDLLEGGQVDLSYVDYLVLDEADRMLEKGFEEDIKKIIGHTDAKHRQTLMFTATWPKEVRELASTFMKNPVKVSIGDRDELSANKRITQVVEVIDPREKERKLLGLLRKYVNGPDKILIFALYKKEAGRVEMLLKRNQYQVAAIHGDLSQQQRTLALNSFKSGESTIMLATDVAARGLDIPNVKVVINLTFPLTAEDYVHRIGRTGRAGQTGIAHTLFTEHEKHLSGALCNILRGANQPVPEELLKFGGHTKKKAHLAYGAFFKDVDMTKTAKKIKFD